MNGDHPDHTARGEAADLEVRRLESALGALREEIGHLRELQQQLETDRQAALRDAVLRTRETIQALERDHSSALRRIEEEADAQLRRLRAEIESVRGPE